MKIGDFAGNSPEFEEALHEVDAAIQAARESRRVVDERKQAAIGHLSTLLVKKDVLLTGGPARFPTLSDGRSWPIGEDDLRSHYQQELPLDQTACRVTRVSLAYTELSAAYNSVFDANVNLKIKPSNAGRDKLVWSVPLSLVTLE